MPQTRDFITQNPYFFLNYGFYRACNWTLPKTTSSSWIPNQLEASRLQQYMQQISSSIIISVYFQLLLLLNSAVLTDATENIMAFFYITEDVTKQQINTVCCIIYIHHSSFECYDKCTKRHILNKTICWPLMSLVLWDHFLTDCKWSINKALWNAPS